MAILMNFWVNDDKNEKDKKKKNAIKSILKHYHEWKRYLKKERKRCKERSRQKKSKKTEIKKL